MLLAWLALGLSAAPAVLWWAGGAPHLPAALPTWRDVGVALNSSEIPPAALLYVLTTAGWLLWLWLAATTLLRCAVAVAEMLTRGSTWARSLRRASDRITLPVIRRLVDGVFAAGLLLTVAGRPAVAAAAGNAAAVRTPVAVPRFAEAVPAADSTYPREAPAPPFDRVAPAGRLYTVVEGDNLWAIAAREYGTGFAYRRIIAANIGREMPDGRRFTYEGVIQPGWTLVLPEANDDIEIEEDGSRWYVVQAGESLSAIAARQLGDASRWEALFASNRGMARLPDGRVLTDPDLVWPGLRLRLPDEAALDQASAEPPRPQDGAAGGDSLEIGQGDWSLAQPSLPEAAGSAASVTEAIPDPVAMVSEPPSSPAYVEGEGARAQTTESAPVATHVAPIPSPEGQTAAGAAPSRPGTPARRFPTRELMAAGAIGGLALGATAAGRRFRRALTEPPIPDPQPEAPSVVEGFAAAPLERSHAQRALGMPADAASLIACETLRLLRTHGVQTAAVLTVYERRFGSELEATVCLRASLAEQLRLPDLGPRLAASLGARECRVTATSDHDVSLRFSALRRSALLSRAAEVTDRATTEAGGDCLPVPVGVAAGSATLYANWWELGHLLLLGSAGGPDVVLTTMLAALAARRPPDDLRIWLPATLRALPPVLRDLPQCLVRGADMATLLRAIQDEIERRKCRGVAAPQVLVLLGDVAQLAEDHDACEVLHAVATQGQACGIQLVALTGRSDLLPDRVLQRFASRIVFQMGDEEQSVRLLGCPDAADLGGGHLLASIAGRAPVRARGFRVAPDQLEQLVVRLRASHGRNDVPAPGEAQRDEDGTTIPAKAVTPALSVVAETQLPEYAGEDISLGEAGGQDTDRPGRPAPASDGAAAEAANRAGPSGPRSQSTVRPNVLAEPLPVRVGGPDGGAGSPAAANGTSATHAASKAQPSGSEQTARAVSVAPVAPPDVAAKAQRTGSDHGDLAAESTPEGTTIRVQCFGVFRVFAGDHEVGPRGKTRSYFQPREVLAFLAAHPAAGVSRDKLLLALWPDADSDVGSRRLTVVIDRVRKMLREHVPSLPSCVVHFDGDGLYRLDPAIIRSDAQEFDALLERAAKLPPVEAKDVYAQACALYRGDLLTEPLFDWVDDRGEDGVTLREAYRERYRQAAGALAQLYCEDGRPDLAVPLYRALLRGEPTLEDIVRRLYRCYWLLGDRASLVLEDQRLRAARRDLFGGAVTDDQSLAEPSAETLALFRQIMDDLKERQGTAGPVPDRQRRLAAA